MSRLKKSVDGSSLASRNVPEKSAFVAMDYCDHPHSQANINRSVDSCRFCHMDWTTSKMERLHWVQWPDADVAHLFESVTGVKLPNAAGFAEYWCHDCVSELRVASKWIQKYRNCADFWRELLPDAEQREKHNFDVKPPPPKTPTSAPSTSRNSNVVVGTKKTIGTAAQPAVEQEPPPPPSSGVDRCSMSTTSDGVENTEEYIDQPFSDYADDNDDDSDEIEIQDEFKLEIEHCDVESALDDAAAAVQVENNALDVVDEEKQAPEFTDTLRFCITPGKRYGSRMLYTLDEKQLYQRTNILPKYDTYMCNGVPGSGCRVSLNVFKPQGIARKCGLYKRHQHGTCEATYLQNLARGAKKLELMADAGLTDQSFDKRSGYRNQIVDTIAEYRRTSALLPPAEPPMRYLLPRLTSFQCDYCGHSGMTRNVLLEHFRDVHGMLRLPCPMCSQTFVTYAQLRSHCTEAHANQTERYEIQRQTPNDTDDANNDELVPSKSAGPELRYEFAPGARYGSQLLYTLDEKHIYRRSNISDNEDLYVCNAPKHMQCRVRLRLSKPTGAVRMVYATQRHNHANAEPVYERNRFIHALKMEYIASNGDASMETLVERMNERGLSLPIEYKDARRLKACLVKMRNRTIPDKNLHYECTDCGEKFRGSLALVNHRSREHPDEPSAPITCPQCPRLRNFSCDYSLQTHIEKVHNNDGSATRPAAAAGSASSARAAAAAGLRCPVCDKKSASLGALSAHFRTHAEKAPHAEKAATGTGRFLCPVCGQSVDGSVTKICMHMKRHQDGLI